MVESIAGAADKILVEFWQRLRQLLGLTAPVVSARGYDGTGELTPVSWSEPSRGVWGKIELTGRPHIMSKTIRHEGDNVRTRCNNRFSFVWSDVIWYGVMCYINHINTTLILCGIFAVTDHRCQYNKKLTSNCIPSHTQTWSTSVWDCYNRCCGIKC